MVLCVDPKHGGRQLRLGIMWASEEISGVYMLGVGEVSFSEAISKVADTEVEFYDLTMCEALKPYSASWEDE